MIISEDSRETAIDLNSFRPIFCRTRARLVLLRTERWIGAGRRWWRLTQIVLNIATVTERIQRSDDRSTIGAFPNADVEGDAYRRLFRRVRPADMRRWLPRGRQLLRRETFNSSMRENAR